MQVRKILAVALFVGLAIWPLGATKLLWVGTPIAWLGITGVLLNLSTSRIESSEPVTYASLYGIGMGWLFLTSLVSGELDHPFNVLPFMTVTWLTIMGIARNKENRWVMAATVYGIVASGIIYAAMVFYFFGFAPLSIANQERSLFDFLPSQQEDSYWGPNTNGIATPILGSASMIVIAYATNFLRLRIVHVVVLGIFSLLILATFSTRATFSLLLILLALVLTFLRKPHRANARLSRWLVVSIVTAAGLVIVFPQIHTVLSLTCSKVLGWVGFAPDVTNDYVYYSATAGNELRHGLIARAFGIFLDNPILGVGLENTRLTLGTFSHFDFVELLAGGGFLAPIPFYWGYWIVLRRSFLSRRSKWAEMAIAFGIISQGFAGGIYKSLWIHVCILVYLLFANQASVPLPPMQATSHGQTGASPPDDPELSVVQ